MYFHLTFWASQHKLLVSFHDLMERTRQKDMTEGQSGSEITQKERERGEGRGGKWSKSGAESK